MKLSNRTDYALRALFSLVEAGEEQLVSTRQLAERNDIPKKFLEQILMEMKQKGWIVSVTGKRGGYRLGKPPGQITMGEVIRHFDGILAPIACVSSAGYKCCSQEAVCRFRRLFLDVRNYAARAMDEATLEAVFKAEPVTREEVFKETLIYGAGI
ncbi:MAG: Rrf2 family transcriptional regulator [Verrucomicrobia bacterium]|nr:Rrf2 family transcriptional regulator [Verrucomicrobiota bacterium]